MQSSKLLSKPFNICVIGVGQMGKIFIPIILKHPYANLHSAIATKFSEQRIMQMKKQHNIPPFIQPKFVESSQFQAFLDKEGADIDGFLILSSTFTHLDYIKQIAPFKKPILLEKPVADSIQQTKEALEIIKKYNLRVTVGFQRRYDPHYRKLYQKVRVQNKVGEMYSITTRAGDYFGPSLEFLKTGGQIILDFGIHDLDFIRYLKGQNPVKVNAFARRTDPKYIEAGCDDYAMIMCEFADKSVSISELKRITKQGYDIRCEVSGVEGIVEVENVPTSSVLQSFGDGLNKASELYPIYPYRFLEAYKNEFEQLVEMMIDEKKMPNTTVEELLDVQKLVMAATQSAKKQMPVMMADYM